MARAIKGIGGSLGLGGSSGVSTKYANDYLNYLNSYDTTNYDTAADNMVAQAASLSENMSDRPNYVYSVDGSDAARQRMENAVYNSAVDKMTPQFEQQRRALETRLQNQGLAVGSQAYENAMSSLNQSQNEALQQAAYQSIQQGQNAFSNSLNDQISTANFQNNARQLPINEIANLLKYGTSGWDVAQAKYNIGMNKAQTENQNRQQIFDNWMDVGELAANTYLGYKKLNK
jgi:hypothetical protein